MVRQYISNSLLILGGGLLLAALCIEAVLQTTSAQLPSPVEHIYADSQRSDTQPVHISMSGLVDSPLTSEQYNEGVWSVSATAASHLNTSAFPEEAGNIIVYGHNKPNILGNLTKVSVGEIVTLTLANGTQREYVITERHRVTLDQVQYLQPTETETLTIYTCAGPFDKDRFVVRAVPLDHSPLLTETPPQEEPIKYEYHDPWKELLAQL